MKKTTYLSLIALLPSVALSGESEQVAILKVNKESAQPPKCPPPQANTTTPTPVAAVTPVAPPTPSYTIDQNYPGRYRENDLFAAMPFPNQSYLQMQASSEFLLWTSGVNQLFAMTTGNDIVPPGNGPYRKMTSFDNHYSPGVRVGALFGFDAQGWDVTATWTRFLNQQKQRVYPPYGNQPFAFLAYILSGNFFPGLNTVADQRHNIAWKLSYNNIGIDFGKEFFLSKYYTLHPRTGGRFLWMKDALQARLTSTANGEFLEARIKNNFHGFGLTAGLDSKFLFGYGLSLLGTLDVGGVYGPLQMDMFTQQSQPGSTGGPYNFNQKSNNLLPFVDTKLNLAWTRSFFDEQTSLELFGGYEYHVLINAFASLQSPLSVGVGMFYGSQSNLYFHGANFGARVSF